jgi:hypothetical protein
MPTPPMGDMAWAASPMNSSPDVPHRGRRSTRTLSDSIASQSGSSCRAGFEQQAEIRPQLRRIAHEIEELPLQHQSR